MAKRMTKKEFEQIDVKTLSEFERRLHAFAAQQAKSAARDSAPWELPVQAVALLVAAAFQWCPGVHPQGLLRQLLTDIVYDGAGRAYSVARVGEGDDVRVRLTVYDDPNMSGPSNGREYEIPIEELRRWTVGLGVKIG